MNATPGAAGSPSMGLSLPPEAESVRVARRYVTGFCRRAHLEDLCDLAALLTSEVVTNAVVHGVGRVQVRPEVLGHGLRIEVSDASPVPPALRHPSSVEEGGRGVALVDSLAGDWGVSPRSGGKMVWFELR